MDPIASYILAASYSKIGSRRTELLTGPRPRDDRQCEAWLKEFIHMGPWDRLNDCFLRGSKMTTTMPPIGRCYLATFAAGRSYLKNIGKLENVEVHDSLYILKALDPRNRSTMFDNAELSESGHIVLKFSTDDPELSRLAVPLTTNCFFGDADGCVTPEEAVALAKKLYTHLEDRDDDARSFDVEILHLLIGKARRGNNESSPFQDNPLIEARIFDSIAKSYSRRGNGAAAADARHKAEKSRAPLNSERASEQACGSNVKVKSPKADDLPSLDYQQRTSVEATSQIPGFIVPRASPLFGKTLYRDGLGFTPFELNKIRPEGSIAMAIGTSTHTSFGSSIGSEINSSSASVRAFFGSFLNSHAYIAAWRCEKRYQAQLDRMLQADLEVFRSAMRAKKDWEPERIFFKRKAGSAVAKPDLEYDMQAVYKLAQSTDPALEPYVAHAKDVLLTAYIINEVAAKRRNRAAYETIRNVLSAGAATLSLTSTVGAVGVLGAANARIAASTATVVTSSDLAKAVRGLKQRLRDDKEEVVVSIELQMRSDFVEFVVSEDSTVQGLRQLYNTLDEKEKEKLINNLLLALHAQARAKASRERYGGIFPGTVINDRKSSRAKKEMRDLVSKHAYTVVHYQMGLGDPEKQNLLMKEWTTIMRSGGTRQARAKQFGRLIDADKGMSDAYQLLRDIGMEHSESIYTMQRLVEMSKESKMAKNPEMSAFSGNAEFAKDDAAQRNIASFLAAALSRM